MSVGFTSKSRIRAADLPPQAWRRRERVGAVHPDSLGLHRLAIATPARSMAIADVVAIVPADRSEATSRLQADGALAQPWARLHGAVQDGLEALWKRIRGDGPGCLSRSGLVSTPNLPMFSYRVFYRCAFDEEDPIVVGVEVWPEADGYRVLGEICGEDSGRSYFDDTVGSARDADALERVVRATVQKLVDQADSLVVALGERA